MSDINIGAFSEALNDKLDNDGGNPDGDVLHALGGTKIEVVASAVLQNDNILYLVPED